MSEIVAVVPEDGIQDTGKIGVVPLYRAGVDVQRLRSLPFGALRREEKSEDHIEIFKAVRGEEGGTGNDGVPRRSITLFESGGKQVLWHGLDEVDKEAAIQNLLEGLPDCTILIEPDDLGPVTLACEGLGHTIEVIRHEGTLATS